MNWKNRQSHSKAVPPEVLLGVPEGTLDLSTAIHLPQRSTAQEQALRQGPVTQVLSPP